MAIWPHETKSGGPEASGASPWTVETGQNGARTPSVPRGARQRSGAAVLTGACRATAAAGPNAAIANGEVPRRLARAHPMTFGKSTVVAGVLALVAFTGAARAVLSRGDARPEVALPPAWLPSPIATEAPTEGARPRRPKMGGPGWRGLRYLAVYGVLIVEVETEQPHRAPAIARRLIAPLQDDYVEVLVYFRRPGAELATTRVQWTPSTGYVTSDISARED